MVSLRVTLILLCLSAPLAAQSVEVGKPWSVAFSPSPSVPPTGAALDYRLYVDGLRATVTVPAPVSGTITVVMPAMTTVGPKVVRLSALWRITNPATFTCPATGCPEAFAPDLSLTAIPAVIPPPPVVLPPGNFRLVVPLTSSGSGAVVFDWAKASIEVVKP